MHKDTSINTSLPDCQGVYMNIATVLNNMAFNMKSELKNAKSIGGTITMSEINDLFATLENQINNSLSQVTNQRIVIELGDNYENVCDKVARNTPQDNNQLNCNLNMNKKLIRLNELDLHRIVKESVKQTLNETRLQQGSLNPSDAMEMLYGEIYNMLRRKFGKDAIWEENEPYMIGVDLGNFGGSYNEGVRIKLEFATYG